VHAILKFNHCIWWLPLRFAIVVVLCLHFYLNNFWIIFSIIVVRCQSQLVLRHVGFILCDHSIFRIFSKSCIIEYFPHIIVFFIFGCKKFDSSAQIFNFTANLLFTVIVFFGESLDAVINKLDFTKNVASLPEVGKTRKYAVLRQRDGCDNFFIIICFLAKSHGFGAKYLGYDISAGAKIINGGHA